jgi:hypothetical protein
MNISKSCSECKVEKNLNGFHKSRSGLYGHNSICKDCRSKTRKELEYEAPLEGTKLCPKCEQTLDISKFNKDKSNSTGLQTYCKECGTQNTKKWASSYDGYFKRLFLDIKHNAKKRAKSLDVNITVDDLKELYEAQNGLCALSGIKMTMDTYMVKENQHIINKYNISVDRINSDKGYDKDNIQLVCAIVNRMKTDLPDNDFIDLCQKIINHKTTKTSKTIIV